MSNCILTPIMNCFNALPVLDSFELGDTTNKTICIDLKHGIAKINATYNNITEKMINEEREKLISLCKDHGIDYNIILSKILLMTGLDIDGDVISLNAFIKALSSVKYELFEKGE